MACMWESTTAVKLGMLVLNRWAHSWARSMEPPWPMHSTFSAEKRMSAARRMASGRISSRVWAMASRSAA